MGYNYTGRWGMRAETLYDEDRKKYPGRRMIGSENPSAGGIRGIYEKVSDPNVFRSGYDTATRTHKFLLELEGQGCALRSRRTQGGWLP